MTLTATVTLPRGRYDAAGRDPRRPETVPSPYRLFCALVAVAARAGDPAEHPGLRWLQRQPPPAVHVPELLDAGLDSGFVVTNRRAAKGGSMSHPGRVNGATRAAWVTFHGPGFAFRWSEDPDAATLAALEALAAGVTYLGRVESTAQVAFETGDTIEPHDTVRELQPVDLSVPGVDVAVPWDGCLDALVDAHTRGAKAWETARPVRYAERRDAEPEVAGGRLGSLLVMRILGRPVAASDLVQVTEAFRSAVLSRVGDVTGQDAIPASIHGHGRDVDHVAFVGLPFVGHRHADGDIRGLAVAVPRDMPDEDLAALGAAVTGTGDGAFDRVSFGRARGGRLDVQYEAFPTSPRLLRPDRWTGPASGCCCWVTATPVMLDRYPKHDRDVPALVADALVTAGHPRPTSVTTSPEALVPGGLRWQRCWMRVLGDGRARRPVVHARVCFGESVVGPVLAGSLRFRGCGLFLPLPEPANRDAGAQRVATVTAEMTT